MLVCYLYKIFSSPLSLIINIIIHDIVMEFTTSETTGTKVNTDK